MISPEQGPARQENTGNLNGAANTQRDGYEMAPEFDSELRLGVVYYIFKVAPFAASVDGWRSKDVGRSISHKLALL